MEGLCLEGYYNFMRVFTGYFTVVEGLCLEGYYNTLMLSKIAQISCGRSLFGRLLQLIRNIIVTLYCCGRSLFERLLQQIVMYFVTIVSYQQGIGIV